MNKNNPLTLLEGKSLKNLILSKIRNSIETVKNFHSSFAPRLVILLLGDDASSWVYVKQKQKSGEEVGISVDLLHFEALTPIQTLLETIENLNKDPSIHGIILQLPLPSHLDSALLLKSLDPLKDVDGTHPINMGRLLCQEDPLFIPATPLGVLRIFSHYGIHCAKKNIVILNRSNIVGKPLAALLGSKKYYGNGTVTLCHTKTKDISEYTKIADILITATSIPHLISESLLKPGCVVVDLGQAVKLVEGKRYIIGDVLYNPENTQITAITPVPGGVGPMTVASLMENVLKSALLKESVSFSDAQYDFF